MPPEIRITTAHVRDLLRKRYAAPEWAFMEEVAPATGGNTRYADAVAMNLWNSRGHVVCGFEIKVSRSDWLRELKDAAKAEPVFRYCDQWWIVAPKGVVRDGELPPTWGLLEVTAAQVRQVVLAPKLSPVPLTREFFASLMRRGHEGLAAVTAEACREAKAAQRAELEREVERRVKEGARHYHELQEEIAAFTAATGLEFSRYGMPPTRVIVLAQALEKLQGWGDNQPLHDLLRLADQLKQASEEVREAVNNVGLGTPS